ncbi:MAG TPA: nucleotidyltransferase family protein [Microbacteriaceae bacterium]|nr:nucleotidyltransferase family protein [Microbacteriaceae bacterium]
MRSSPEPRLAAVVLAAGSSSRLGRPKQLLPFGDGVLLDVVLDLVREGAFAQRIVTLGGSADEVRATVDLSGFDVVLNDDFRSGCSSSIGAAIGAVDPDVEGIVLLLGDQPMMRAESIEAVVRGRGDAPIAVARYRDGIGHPFVLSRATFPALGALQGDRGVWKLIERLGTAVARVDIASGMPADVDTESDYQALLAETPGPA